MAVRVRFPSGAHDPSRFPRGIFVYICLKGVDFCSKGGELWLKGGVLCPLNIDVYGNSLAASQLQNLTMFEGLKYLPFEHKTLPFEHLGRIVLSGSERTIWNKDRNPVRVCCDKNSLGRS